MLVVKTHYGKLHQVGYTLKIVTSLTVVATCGEVRRPLAIVVTRDVVWTSHGVSPVTSNSYSVSVLILPIERCIPVGVGHIWRCTCLNYEKKKKLLILFVTKKKKKKVVIV